MKKLISLSFFLFFLYSCSTEPQEIQYGHEECHFCTMKISDDRFASQLVLTTGKALKFCSIECMVRNVNRSKTLDKKDIDNYYVIDMTMPNKFVEANSAIYLISKKISSPMGENLAAFSSKSKADEMKRKWDGEILTWNKLLKRIN